MVSSALDLLGVASKRRRRSVHPPLAARATPRYGPPQPLQPNAPLPRRPRRAAPGSWPLVCPTVAPRRPGVSTTWPATPTPATHVSDVGSGCGIFTSRGNRSPRPRGELTARTHSRSAPSRRCVAELSAERHSRTIACATTPPPRRAPAGDRPSRRDAMTARRARRRGTSRRSPRRGCDLTIGLRDYALSAAAARRIEPPAPSEGLGSPTRCGVQLVVREGTVAPATGGRGARRGRRSGVARAALHEQANGSRRGRAGARGRAVVVATCGVVSGRRTAPRRRGSTPATPPHDDEHSPRHPTRTPHARIVDRPVSR